MYRTNNDIADGAGPDYGRTGKGDLPPEAPLVMPVQDLSRVPDEGKGGPLAYFGPLFQRLSLIHI